MANATRESETRPRPGGSHIVQFYEDDVFLSRVVSDFLLEGISSSERLLVIATAALWEQVRRRLADRDVDVEAHRAAGTLLVLDARATLESLRRDGAVDEAGFELVIGEALAGAKGAPSPRVRAYGEMVDLLLREGLSDEALRLEALWNEIGRKHDFTLMCGYGLSSFGSEADRTAFQKICTAHTHVLPAESFLGLEDPEARLREVSVLQQRAAALETEVEHRRRIELELRKALEIREEFLSVAGHELRTPITPLALKTQLLMREARAQPDSDFARRVRDYTESTARQLSRLTELVNELLDVSRISAGRFDVTLEDVELGEVVREVVSRYEEHAARAKTPVSVFLSEPLLIRADRFRLEQVVTNLLDNALKYGLEQPVEVRTERDGDAALLTVRDRGIGIPAEFHARIFERFERAVSGRSYGGLGLGLFITRTVVEALGGTIQVDAAPDQGSTFVVSLPISRS